MSRHYYNMRCRNRSSGGFTLLEILIVMGLAGVFVALMLPDFNRVIPEMKVDKAARKLATDIRMTRQKAVSEMSTVWFWLDPDENWYRTWVLDRDGNWDELEDPLHVGTTLSVDFDEIDAFKSVDVVVGGWVRFNPLGSVNFPLTDVTYTLQHATTGYQRQVFIDYPLGKVTILP